MTSPNRPAIAPSDHEQPNDEAVIGPGCNANVRDVRLLFDGSRFWPQILIRSTVNDRWVLPNDAECRYVERAVAEWQGILSELAFGNYQDDERAAGARRAEIEQQIVALQEQNPLLREHEARIAVYEKLLVEKLDVYPRRSVENDLL